MILYENRSPSKSNISKKVDVSKILNDKNLTSLVKEISPKLTAKEVLYDTEGNVIGILMRNNEPYFFSEKELSTFLKLWKENGR